MSTEDTIIVGTIYVPIGQIVLNNEACPVLNINEKVRQALPKDVDASIRHLSEVLSGEGELVDNMGHVIECPQDWNAKVAAHFSEAVSADTNAKILFIPSIDMLTRS